MYLEFNYPVSKIFDSIYSNISMFTRLNYIYLQLYVLVQSNLIGLKIHTQVLKPRKTLKG